MLSLLTASCILGGAILLAKTSSCEEEDFKDIEALNDIFKEKKLKNFKNEYAYIYDKKTYEHYTEYYVSIPIGNSTDDLDKCLPSIETWFKNNASIEYKDKSIYIKLYTSDLRDEYKFKVTKVDKTKGLCLFLGNSREGVIVSDLLVNPHLSVVGVTGSGKSVYVNCILCNLIENYTSEELELVLFDLKGNELNEYNDLEHTIFHSTDVDKVIEYFDVLEKELKKRYETLGNYRDIKAYNKANPYNKMKYQFIVIEECFSLLEHKKSYDKLGVVMSKARACGMHFMLTTQRPSGDIIPKSAYTHVGIKVGLKTSSAQESINAIECPGLEKLGGRGSGIIKLNSKYTYFKGSNITDEQIVNITKKHKRRDFEVKSIENIEVLKKDNVEKESKLFDFEGEL